MNMTEDPGANQSQNPNLPNDLGVLLLISQGEQSVLDLNKLLPQESGSMINVSCTDDNIYVVLNNTNTKIQIITASKFQLIQSLSHPSLSRLKNDESKPIELDYEGQLSTIELFCSHSDFLLRWKYLSNQDRVSIFINQNPFYDQTGILLNYCGNNKRYAVFWKDIGCIRVDIITPSGLQKRSIELNEHISCHCVAIYQDCLYLYYDSCLRRIDLSSSNNSPHRIEPKVHSSPEILALHAEVDENGNDSCLYAMTPNSLICYQVTFCTITPTKVYGNPDVFELTPVPEYNKVDPNTGFYPSMNWRKSTSTKTFVNHYTSEEYNAAFGFNLFMNNRSLDRPKTLDELIAHENSTNSS